MEKYKNIKEWCMKNEMTVDDLKDMMLTSALNLGCSVEKNFDEDIKSTAQVFDTLSFFNDIINNVD